MAILAAGGNGSSGIVLLKGYPASFGAGARTAAYRINTDGYVYHGDNGGYTSQYQWKQNANASSGYEAYATLIIGSVSGTTGAWVGLGSTVEWSITDSTDNSEPLDATLEVSIRNASTLGVLATATVEFYASRGT